MGSVSISISKVLVVFEQVKSSKLYKASQKKISDFETVVKKYKEVTIWGTKSILWFNKAEKIMLKNGFKIKKTYWKNLNNPSEESISFKIDFIKK